MDAHADHSSRERPQRGSHNHGTQATNSTHDGAEENERGGPDEHHPGDETSRSPCSEVDYVVVTHVGESAPGFQPHEHGP